MKKNTHPRRTFGLTAALMIGSLALSGCTSAEKAPAEETEAAQTQPAPPEEQPTEETLYGVEMPTLREDMSESEREQTEHQRFVALMKSAQTRENVAYRLGKIWKVADTTSMIESTNAKTAEEFAERAVDMTFKTVEGKCLAEKLSEDDLAGYVSSVETAAQKKFDSDYPSWGFGSETHAYWLHYGFEDLSHDEALAKTDALYQAIEDSGCMVMSQGAPEMVPDWNH